MSYGRKKRSTSEATQDNSHVKMTVTKQVTVMDGNHRTPRTSGFGIIEEEVIHPKIATPSNTNAEPPKSALPKEYLIGGSALVISLFVSVCINIYLLVMTRRRFNNNGSDGSSSDSSVHEAPVFGNRYHPMMRNDLYYNRYSSPKVEWKYESREILYPPMPIRHASAAQRAHSFRY